jgi:hypothetical protein
MLNKGFKGLFLFLTPDGREAETKDENSKYICYNISYQNILTVLDKLKHENEVSNCVLLLMNSIKEDIVMDTLTQKNINALWGDVKNRDYLNILINNRPGIMSIKDSLFEKINGFLNNTKNKIVDVGEWSNKEIRFSTNLIGKKMPLFFVFYDGDDQLNRPFNSGDLRLTLSC